MKINLITPYKNLKQSEKGDMYFALTRQLFENKDYYNFFKKKKEEGFEVFIDNNVHEEDPMNFENHVEIALEVGTIIIIPDVLRNAKKTLEYYHYFMDKYYSILKENNIKIMAVPQGDSMCEIMKCFDEFNNDERVDFIGNSFDLTPFLLHPSKYENQSLNRFMILREWLKVVNKPIHMLGSNNLYELYFFSRFKNIYSTDGKIFSRLALSKTIIDQNNWRELSKPDMKMKFEDEFTTTQKVIFNNNVDFFKSLIS